MSILSELRKRGFSQPRSYFALKSAPPVATIATVANLLEHAGFGPTHTAFDPCGGTGWVHLTDLDTYAFVQDDQLLDIASQLGQSVQGDLRTCDPGEMNVFEGSDWPILFDVVVTSPIYGCALERPGEDLLAGATWSDEYRSAYLNTWSAVLRVLDVGGKLIVVLRDLPHEGGMAPITDWHKEAIQAIGFEFINEINVPLPKEFIRTPDAQRHDRIVLFKKSFGARSSLTPEDFVGSNPLASV